MAPAGGVVRGHDPGPAGHSSDWAPWMERFSSGAIGLLTTLVGALAGPFIQTRLTARHAEEAWRRDGQAKAYAEVLAHAQTPGDADRPGD
jgi:hypothetical protein